MRWLFLKALPIVLTFFTIARFYFWLNNLENFSELNALHTFYAFIHGIRFDLTAFIYINSIFIAITLFLPFIFRFPLAKRLYFYSFIGTNALLFIVNCLDALYFPFSGRRSGIYILSLYNDFKEQSTSLLIQYKFQLLIILAMAGLFVWSLQFTVRTLQKKRLVHWLAYLPITCLTLGLIILSGRGTLGSKPITSAFAFTWPNPSAGNLVLNTAFSIKDSFSPSIKPLHIFKKDADAYAYLPKKCFFYGEVPPKQLPNIVLIIAESLGQELFLEHNKTITYVPFLEGLAQKSLYFTNALANGRRSIDAVPALLSGLPNLQDIPYANSAYTINNVVGFPTILSRYGYTTAFFHGGKNGTMYFDAMSKKFGIKHYYGKNEVADPDKEDGSWGIYDRPMLEYASDKMNGFTQPFFSAIFTLSSHNPYTIEEQFRAQFPEQETPFHTSIRYLDVSLKQFFEKSRHAPWFNNTLFIITGDHAPPSQIRLFNQTLMDEFRIPIIFYTPNNKLQPKKIKHIVQQIDIAPSVLDYLGISNEAVKLSTVYGNSLFCNRHGYALVWANNHYHLVTNKGETTMDSNGITDKSNDSATLLKALVQLYRNSMVENYNPNLKLARQVP